MKKLTWWITIILSMLVLQTVTYFAFGPMLLRSKLLPGYFPISNPGYDTLYVIDPPTPECTVGDRYTFLPQMDRQNEKKLKEKFNVHCVVFDTGKNQRGGDTPADIKLVYSTWTKRWDWTSLFGLYGADKTETFYIKKKVAYTREGTYHWILFFWIHTFEWFHSDNLD